MFSIAWIFFLNQKLPSQFKLIFSFKFESKIFQSLQIRRIFTSVSVSVWVFVIFSSTWISQFSLVSECFTELICHGHLSQFHCSFQQNDGHCHLFLRISFKIEIRSHLSSDLRPPWTSSWFNEPVTNSVDASLRQFLVDVVFAAAAVVAAFFPT